MEIKPNEYLKALIQKEIHLMREMLANMHLEATVLRNNDKPGWAQALSERGQILQILTPLREERIQMTNIINKTSSYTEDMEILSLCEQLLTLIQKINAQNLLNQRLTTHPQPLLYGQNTEPFAKKKKTSIATYSPGEDGDSA